jgi:hypothetical protein
LSGFYPEKSDSKDARNWCYLVLISLQPEEIAISSKQALI